jgi:hypothetical protein
VDNTLGLLPRNAESESVSATHKGKQLAMDDTIRVDRTIEEDTGHVARR